MAVASAKAARWGDYAVWIVTTPYAGMSSEHASRTTISPICRTLEAEISLSAHPAKKTHTRHVKGFTSSKFRIGLFWRRHGADSVVGQVRINLSLSIPPLKGQRKN